MDNPAVRLPRVRAAAEAGSQYRQRNLRVRYQTSPVRARIGRDARKLSRSSENCSTEAYRSCGSSRNALRRIASRSPFNSGASLEGGRNFPGAVEARIDSVAWLVDR